MLKILAIIPARGGSVGIPRKNIRKLAGIPLIEHSILSAKKSHKIDKIVVTTDDKKIAKIAKSAGAEVPFLRPKKLSKNKTIIIHVIKHTLKFLKTNQSFVPDIILLLQPTSPLRTIKLLEQSINILKKSKATSVITLSEVITHPYYSFWLKNGTLKPFVSNFEKYNRRQDFPKLYYPTGTVYAFWRKTLEKYDSIYGPKIIPLFEKQEDHIDIDTDFDFFIAEMHILYWKKFIKKFRHT
jgi:CMP-N-acetylneuraminic acid synthetase